VVLRQSGLKLQAVIEILAKGGCLSQTIFFQRMFWYKIMFNGIKKRFVLQYQSFWGKSISFENEL
jgi:hypothetical protein